jgi:hypothetical protein
VKLAKVVDDSGLVHGETENSGGERGEIGCEYRIGEASYDWAGIEIGGVNCGGIHTEIAQTTLPVWVSIGRRITNRKIASWDRSCWYSTAIYRKAINVEFEI